MKVGVLVGNPKRRSRTLEAGVLVAKRLTGFEPTSVIDLVDFGSALLEFGNTRVVESVQVLQGLDVLIVASPTYKATYTGLLKLYLDQIPSDGLAGIVALPLMLGAGPSHALAPELHLKPVLVELGAICPAPGLYLLDSTFAKDAKLDAWIIKTKFLLRSFVPRKDSTKSC
jgi:FMN reductase